VISESTIEPATVSDIVTRVEALYRDGWRLAQIGCTRTADGAEINYSFDKALTLRTLRVTLKSLQETLPSVSRVCFPAFHYENEIHDLFGIPVDGMAIDYKGDFYRKAHPAPFAKPPEEKKDV